MVTFCGWLMLCNALNVIMLCACADSVDSVDKQFFMSEIFFYCAFVFVISFWSHLRLSSLSCLPLLAGTWMWMWMNCHIKVYLMIIETQRKFVIMLLLFLYFVHKQNSKQWNIIQRWDKLCAAYRKRLFLRDKTMLRMNERWEKMLNKASQSYIFLYFQFIEVHLARWW